MSAMIEVSASVARNVVPLLEAKLQSLEDQSEGLLQEISGLKTALAEMKAKLNGSELPLANGQYRQRLPKGHGEQVIADLLKSLEKGEGLSMAEICRRTGINHSTVFRTLRDPRRNNGRFIGIGNLWSLKK